MEKQKETSSIPLVKDDFDPTDGLADEAMRLVAVPGAFAAGAYQLNNKIRTLSRDRLSNNGAFDHEKNERLHKIKAVLPVSEHSPAKDITNEIKEANRTFTHSVRHKMHNMGYTNLWKRYNSLSRDQRTEAIFSAFTAAGIVVGVMYTIADHGKLFGHFKAYEKTKDQNQDQGQGR